MAIELPNMASATKNRIMKYLMSLIVFSSSLVKKAVFSNSLSQSKNFAQIVKSEIAAIILYHSLFS